MERKLGRKCSACLFLSASNTCLHKFCLEPEYDCHSAQRRPSFRHCFFKKKRLSVFGSGIFDIAQTRREVILGLMFPQTSPCSKDIG